MNTQETYDTWRRWLRKVGLPNVPRVLPRGTRRGLRDNASDIAIGFMCSLDFAIEAVDDFRPVRRRAKEDSDWSDDARALQGDWLAVGGYIQTAIDKMGRELGHEPHARE